MWLTFGIPVSSFPPRAARRRGFLWTGSSYIGREQYATLHGACR